jgi:hypothetical protein
MKCTLIALIATFLGSAAAQADTAVSSEDTEKIQAALQAWDCSGGKMEKETEATGIFKVDDAKCHGDEYYIKLNTDFKMISIIRD